MFNASVFNLRLSRNKAYYNYFRMLFNQRCTSKNERSVIFMRKFFKFTALILFIVLISITANAEEILNGNFLEPPIDFLDWQADQEELQDYSGIYFDQDSPNNFVDGYIPLPVDLSYVGRNKTKSINFDQASNLPSSYNVKNLVTSVKNQGSYGTCWAHSAIGAMESNYIKTYGSTIDLSIMHLAWFAYVNPTSSKVFCNYGTSSSLDTILSKGGNIFVSTALYSRLDGATLMSNLPYMTQPEKTALPSDYQKVVRLKDVFYLNMDNTQNVNSSEEQRNIIKQRIIDNGAIVASYKNNYHCYKVTSNGTSFYSGNTSGTNHAIMIVGWDDNFSKSNFVTEPSINGAWLIKNSWSKRWGAYDEDGNTIPVGDEGYFWMSYEEYLKDGAAFTVEEYDTDLKCYYYDALGWCRTYTYTDANQVYTANVFLPTRGGEYLHEVGFYAPDDNLHYNIEIYTGLSSIPSSSPISGAVAYSQSGAVDYAGYHTIKLNSPVKLPDGKYFSVIVRFDNTSYIPIEGKLSGFSDNAVVEKGSFFSYNGSTWQTGSTIGGNACVKAFTKTSDTGVNPGISTSNLSDAVLNQSYSAKLTSTGTPTISFTIIDGSLPTGLTMTSLGYISGTPTTAGYYSFTVRATNAYGSVTKSFSIGVYDGITITTKEFSGAVGYSFNETLKTNLGSDVTWMANASLPAGLSLNENSGVIKGKPSKDGTFTVSFTATHSTGTVTSDVIFTIEPKPEKPKFEINSLPKAYVSTDYSQEITLTGTDPISLDVTGLPDGFTLVDKILQGNTSKSGTYTLKFTAQNHATELDGKSVTKNLKLMIRDAAPVFSLTSLEDGIVDVEYTSVQLSASVGTNITWKASGLPSGLKLTEEGLLYGTPKRAGNFNVKITAKNTGGSLVQTAALKIYEIPSVTTTRFSNAITGKNYKASVKFAGTKPFTSLDVSGLPEGFTFNGDLAKGTGTITGLTRVAGNYSVDITAYNYAGSCDKTLNLKVTGVAPRISIKNVRKGKVDTFFGLSADLTGSTPMTVTYSIASSDLTKAGISGLDDLNLSFDYCDVSFSLSGTSSKSVKNLPITFTASNSFGTYSKRTSITIAGIKPSFTNPADDKIILTVLPGAHFDYVFDFNGTRPVTVTATNLTSSMGLHQKPYDPCGLPNDAHLFGDAPLTEGKHTITIKAQNADGKATRKIIIQTKTLPNISTESLPDGKLKKAYSQKLTATGSKPITWKILSGAIPNGITFNSKNATFKGKPTYAGTFTFTVQAENVMGSVSKDFTIRIIDPSAENNTSDTDSPIEIFDNDVSTSESTNEINGTSKNIADEDENTSANINESESSNEISTQDINFDTSENLTGKLTDEGLIIAAVLPEMEVFNAGEYRFTALLDDNVKAGMKLFLRTDVNDLSSENYENVKFYSGGQEIDSVPENRTVEILLTLDAGKYEPVILAGDVAEISSDMNANENDGSGIDLADNSSSGGCNLGACAIGLLLVILLKRR